MKKTTTNFLGYMALATCLQQIVCMGNVYAAAQDIPQPRLSTTMKARMPLFGLTPEVHNHIMKRLLDESADQASLHSLLSQQGRANDMALVLSDAYLKAEPLMQTVAAYVAAPKETVAQSISSLSARSEAHENLGSITSADLHAFKNLLGSQHIEAPHKDAIRPIVEGLDIIISRSHAAAVEEDQALQASLKTQLSTLKNHFNPDQDTLLTLERQIDERKDATEEFDDILAENQNPLVVSQQIPIDFPPLSEFSSPIPTNKNLELQEPSISFQFNVRDNELKTLESICIILNNLRASLKGLKGPTIEGLQRCIHCAINQLPVFVDEDMEARSTIQELYTWLSEKRTQKATDVSIFKKQVRTLLKNKLKTLQLFKLRLELLSQEIDSPKKGAIHKLSPLKPVENIRKDSLSSAPSALKIKTTHTPHQPVRSFSLRRWLWG
ncbi:MAG: hypothetical protein WCG05_05630 [Alphaproteobacteria bacterium]